MKLAPASRPTAGRTRSGWDESLVAFVSRWPEPTRIVVLLIGLVYVWTGCSPEPSCVILASLDSVSVAVLVFRTWWAWLPILVEVLVDFQISTGGNAMVWSALWILCTVPFVPRRRLRVTIGLAAALTVLLVLPRPAGAPRPDPAFVAIVCVMASAASASLRRERDEAAGASQTLDELAARVGSARGEERSRLAEELHGAVGAQLARARSMLGRRPSVTTADGRRALLDEVDGVLRAALVEMRLVLAVLVEPDGAAAAQDLTRAVSVADAISELQEEFAERGIPLRLSLQDDLGELGMRHERTLVRVLRDGVAPILRGSRRPEEARVDLIVSEGEVSVRVDLADGLLAATPALDARLELLGTHAQRWLRADGGSSMLVRLAPAGPVIAPSRGWPRGVRLRLHDVRSLLLAGACFVAASITGPPTNAYLAAFGVLALHPLPGTVACLVALAIQGPTSHFSDVGLVLAALTLAWLPRSSARSALLWFLAQGLTAVLVTVAGSDGLADVPSYLLADVLGLVLLAPRLQTRRLAARRRELEDELGEIRSEVRVDLARDLHDVTAHHLSVATLQVMGHRHSDDPAELDLVLDRVQRAVEEAACELGGLGAVMDVEPTEATVLTPSEMARRVVAELETAGHPVDVAVAPALDALPDSRARTVSRVLQEAATNALKYAPSGSIVALRAQVAEGEVSVRVTSAYAPGASHRGIPSSGLGLRGLADRVELLGGAFSAGPVGDRWVVAATMPLDG